MPRTVILKDCNDEFADLVYDLHSAFQSRVKMGISIHLSGSPENFKCNIEKLDSASFFKLLKQSEKEKSE